MDESTVMEPSEKGRLRTGRVGLPLELGEGLLKESATSTTTANDRNSSCSLKAFHLDCPGHLKPD